MSALLLSTICGVFYGVSFPPFEFHLLGWACLIPLLSITKTNNPFRVGLWAGFIANIFIFSWLWETFRAAQINTPTTIGCWLALALVLGIYFGLFFSFCTALPFRCGLN